MLLVSPSSWTPPCGARRDFAFRPSKLRTRSGEDAPSQLDAGYSEAYWCRLQRRGVDSKRFSTKGGTLAVAISLCCLNQGRQAQVAVHIKHNASRCLPYESCDSRVSLRDIQGSGSADIRLLSIEWLQQRKVLTLVTGETSRRSNQTEHLRVTISPLAPIHGILLASTNSQMETSPASHSAADIAAIENNSLTDVTMG
ncbi:hypothetical protein VTK56DRAFT_1924 [Thermocarpiscus australiensis]